FEDRGEVLRRPRLDAGEPGLRSWTQSRLVEQRPLIEVEAERAVSLLSGEIAGRRADRRAQMVVPAGRKGQGGSGPASEVHPQATQGPPEQLAHKVERGIGVVAFAGGGECLLQVGPLGEYSLVPPHPLARTNAAVGLRPRT